MTGGVSQGHDFLALDSLIEGIESEREGRSTLTLTVSAVTPAVEVSEDDDGYLIGVELPGIDPQDVEIMATNGRLTMKAERHQQDPNRSVLISEFGYGVVRRNFKLPADVEIRGIAASWQNSILTIALPKCGEARDNRRRIEIKAL